jgi:hypothetical protein
VEVKEDVEEMRACAVAHVAKRGEGGGVDTLASTEVSVSGSQKMGIRGWSIEYWPLPVVCT